MRKSSPLRCDIAGSWLDVPRFAIPGSYIVNVAIQPLVSLPDLASINTSGMTPGQVMALNRRMATAAWPYEHPGAGLGGSAAWHILNGRDALKEELAAGGGWQDAGALSDPRGGILVWASGPEPVLVHRDTGDWLRGLLALHWTGKTHNTASLVDLPRDYNAIASASQFACKAVMGRSMGLLSAAINMSYCQQTDEGMDELPALGLAAKYCGAGHGGYAVYLFENQTQRDRAVREKGMMAIEPYCKP